MPTPCPHPATAVETHCTTVGCPWAVCPHCRAVSRDRGHTWHHAPIRRDRGCWTLAPFIPAKDQ